MRLFIKFLLVLLTFACALFNYRIVSLSSGMINIKGTPDDLASTIKTILTIEEIEYYTMPAKSCQEDKNNIVFIVKTATDNYIYYGNENDIAALRLLGKIDSTFDPNRILVLPIWMYFLIIAGIIVFPKRRKDGEKSSPFVTTLKILLLLCTLIFVFI